MRHQITREKVEEHREFAYELLSDPDDEDMLVSMNDIFITESLADKVGICRAQMQKRLKRDPAFEKAYGFHPDRGRSCPGWMLSDSFTLEDLKGD